MLLSNWYMINTFVLNLGTAMVLIFVICRLTYCIEFSKFVYLFLSFFDQKIFVFIISDQCCCFGSTHSIGFQEIFRYL